MKSLGYNFALIGANILFALNFSLFASALERESLSIEAIYLLQCVVMFVAVALWRLFSFGRATATSRRVNLRDALRIWGISSLSSLGWSFAMLWGMSLTSPIDAATIAAAGPSLTLILAHFMRRRELTRVRLWGVAFSLLGVAISVVGRWPILLSGGAAQGNLILVGAVSIAAINTLILKPLLERYGLLEVAWRYSLSALALSVPLFFKDIDFKLFTTLSGVDLFEIIGLLLLGGTLPLLLLFEGTERLSPLHTSLYRYLQPFVTSAVVVVREQARLSAANYVALAVIILGCVMVSKGVDRSE